VAAVYTDPDGNLDDNSDGVIDAKDAVDDVLTSPARDWGALVRVSTGDAVKVIRQGVDTLARRPGRDRCRRRRQRRRGAC
jgi:filamentous hemagglutinin